MSLNPDLENLENQIGFPSSCGYEAIIPFNKHQYVISWLILKGIPKQKAETYSIIILGKAYGIPKYLDQILYNERNTPKTKIKKLNISNISFDPIPPPPPSDLSSQEEENWDHFDRTNPERSEGREVKNLNPSINLDLDKINTLVESITQNLVRDLLDKDLIKNKKIFLEQGVSLHNQILEAVKKKLQEGWETNKIQTKTLALEIAKETILNLAPRRIIIQHKDAEFELNPNEARHKIFETCLSYLGLGEHIYVVGPAGTGKTHTGKQIAEALNLDFLPMPQALTKYELSGYLDGSGTYRGTVFRQAIEHGGLLVMDEIDINGASAIAFANSVMANGYCAFPDKMVLAHPDLKIMACANTYGFGATQKYIGRNPLDAASLDRFRYIECDYDEQLERMIYSKSEWLDYVHKVRKALTQLNLDHIVSMRAIQRGLNDIILGKTPEQVASSIWRNLSPDTILKIQNLSGKYLGETSNLRSVA